MISKIADIDICLAMWFTAIVGFLAPIETLLTLTTVFTVVDFVSSLTAVVRFSNKKRIKKNVLLTCERHLFIMIFSVVIISLAWILGTYVIEVGSIKLEHTVASAICGYSFINIGKNASRLSRGSVFRAISRFIKVKLPK